MSDKDLIEVSGKTDERQKGDWKSRYPDKKAKTKQFIEACYILVVVMIAFVLLLFNYNGVLENWLNILDCKRLYFSRIVTCTLCGLLGGAIFDMKWFYKSIAHGFWNEDRLYWRLFMPIISLSLAFCLACIFKDNIVVYGDGFSAATIGFLSGYFSDEAVGKMAEVAKVLFNTNGKQTDNIKPSDNKEENE